MKKSEVFSFVVSLLLVNSHVEGNHLKEDFTVLQSIKGALKDYYALKEPNVHLINCGNKSEILAEKLLREKPPNVTLHVTRLKAVANITVKFPAIILYDSGELFKQFETRIVPHTNVQIFPNLLVFVPKRGKVDILAELTARSIAVENTNFINIVNDSTVDLVTSFMFEPGKCKQAQYKTINRFSLINMNWDSDTFFPEKYDNFNGCELIIAHGAILPGEYTRTTSFKLFEILAESLNFKAKYVGYRKNSTELQYFDLMNYINTQSSVRYNIVDFSPSLYCDHVTLTVPAGKPYTQLEKMFLMFDKETWICIGVTLAGALLVIQVINLMSVQVQKFVFGRDVRSPTLNVANVFLTGAQHRVPGRNFARFMLMMFIIWSLIIRTCYQSILYKNLQQDMRKPKVKTFDELNKENFTILYVQENVQELGTEFINRLVIRYETVLATKNVFKPFLQKFLNKKHQNLPLLQHSV
jgi:hypothetical protein